MLRLVVEAETVTLPQSYQPAPSDGDSGSSPPSVKPVTVGAGLLRRANVHVV